MDCDWKPWASAEKNMLQEATLKRAGDELLALINHLRIQRAAGSPHDLLRHLSDRDQRGHDTVPSDLTLLDGT